MFFFCVPKDNHIIQIDDAIGQIKLSQCILHQMLECCRCITQSKGHIGKFIETQVANRECGYCCDSGAMQTGQNPLLKSIVEKWVAPAMISSTSCILGRGYESFFVRVLRYLKVNAEWKESIFLPHQYHYITPGRLARSDSASIQHISLSDAWSSSGKGGGMCLKHSLNGSSSLM